MVFVGTTLVVAQIWADTQVCPYNGRISHPVSRPVWKIFFYARAEYTNGLLDDYLRQQLKSPTIQIRLAQDTVRTYEVAAFYPPQSLMKKPLRALKRGELAPPPMSGEVGRG